MSGVNHGKRSLNCSVTEVLSYADRKMFAYRSILREQARPAVVRESRRAPWLAVGVVCFGAFMGQLDASIVTITFPAMEHDFGVPVAAVQWVSLAYLLGLVAMLAPAGRLGDAAGRKLVYTYGFAVFSLASAACGLASSLGVLVGLRLLQAVGAAMLQANSVALVTTSAPKARMRFALGIQAGAQAAGLALGPTLGGLLTATAGWRAVYWVNVPVGVVAVIAGRYLLPRTRQFSRPGRFDGPGTALLVTWTTALLLALSAVSGLSLPPGLAVLLAVLALVGLVAFARREIHTVHPLIPVWLLRSRSLALGLAGAGCGYLALFGPLVLIPQVLSRGPGSAARTGLLLSALPLGFGLAALLGDLMLPRGWSDRRRGLAGALLADPGDRRRAAGRGRRRAGHLRAREQHGDHAQCGRLVCLPGRRPGQHGPGDRHHARHLADGPGLAPR
jgi:MFS family permease